MLKQIIFFICLSLVLSEKIVPLENKDIVNLNQDEFANEALMAHNLYRRIHGVPALKLNNKLIDLATSRARELANDGKLNVKQILFRGENLGETVGAVGGFSSYNGISATQLWYSVVSKFDEEGESSNEGASFTQMVWKKTQEVGFGISKAKDGKFYFVAEYYPSGNIRGQYEENVFQLTEDESTIEKKTNCVNQTVVDMWKQLLVKANVNVENVSGKSTQEIEEKTENKKLKSKLPVIISKGDKIQSEENKVVSEKIEKQEKITSPVEETVETERAEKVVPSKVENIIEHEKIKSIPTKEEVTEKETEIIPKEEIVEIEKSKVIPKPLKEKTRPASIINENDEITERIKPVESDVESEKVRPASIKKEKDEITRVERIKPIESVVESEKVVPSKTEVVESERIKPVESDVEIEKVRPSSIKKEKGERIKPVESVVEEKVVPSKMEVVESERIKPVESDVESEKVRPSSIKKEKEEITHTERIKPVESDEEIEKVRPASIKKEKDERIKPVESVVESVVESEKVVPSKTEVVESERIKPIKSTEEIEKVVPVSEKKTVEKIDRVEKVENVTPSTVEDEREQIRVIPTKETRNKNVEDKVKEDRIRLPSHEDENVVSEEKVHLNGETHVNSKKVKTTIDPELIITPESIEIELTTRLTKTKAPVEDDVNETKRVGLKNKSKISALLMNEDNKEQEIIEEPIVKETKKTGSLPLIKTNLKKNKIDKDEN